MPILAPRPKVTFMGHLTSEQRYTISSMHKQGFKQVEIARTIGKDKSVVSRELKRNISKRGYSSSLAQTYANERKARFGINRKFTKSMQILVEKHLVEDQWSPEQISGYYRSRGVEMVSSERIYQHIRNDKSLGGELYKHCRHRLKHRKRPVGGKKIVIPNKISIDLRPDIINNKERFGDWEIDLIVGKNGKGAILTATERKTTFLLMKKLPEGKNAMGLQKAITNMFFPYKQFVFSITSDNGTEFYQHEMIARKLDAQYYFAHPYSSWERGLNEYTNKLIRQYIPKKEVFENYTNEQILKIQHKINARPRKNLNFDNPKNEFFKNINLKVAFDS